MRINPSNNAGRELAILKPDWVCELYNIIHNQFEENIDSDFLGFLASKKLGLDIEEVTGFYRSQIYAELMLKLAD